MSLRWPHFVGAARFGLGLKPQRVTKVKDWWWGCFKLCGENRFEEEGGYWNVQEDKAISERKKMQSALMSCLLCDRDRS